MELKPGYKQTEAGVIPIDWIERRIGDLHPFVTSGSRGWAAYYSDSGDPFIRITNLTRSSIYLCLDNLRFVKIPEGDSEGVRTQLQNGDVLISITADIGIIGFVSKDIPQPAYINQHIALIRFDELAVCPQFVSYFLASERPQRIFRALTDSGAKAGMNLSTVQQVGLTLPPTVVEQEAIATALSDADALIKSLEQLLVKKRQIKQGAMQELLTGKKRLPGFSELWMETTIGDAVERIVGGGTPSRMVPGYWGGDVPWMTVKDFAHHDTRGTIEYITREGLKRSASNLIPKGTLITSTRMALGKAVVFEVDVSINQDLKALFPKPSIDTRFLYYWFEANQQGIAEIGSGSTVMGISLGELRKIPFVKPSLREQQAIASVLTVMDAELETIERKLTKACQLKQGMMQELLTGKIRLGRPSADVLSFPTKKSSSVADVSHNTHFNEAVVIAVLSAKFGSEKFPLGRFRRTKFSYLLHRHVEHEAVGFMKMAAGPYNPNTRYGGAEKIALQNRYVRVLTTGKSEGFVADENIAQAEGYFEKWYGVGVLTWLKQFHYYKNDALGLLTTVDMACEDLSRTGKAATLSAVKQVIRDNPKWKPKLDRPEFSDDNIEKTIQSCGQLFPIGKE